MKITRRNFIEDIDLRDTEKMQEIYQIKRVRRTMSAFCCSTCGVVMNLLNKFKSREKIFCSEQCKETFFLQKKTVIHDKMKNTCSFCKKNYPFALTKKSQTKGTVRLICPDCNTALHSKYMKTKKGRISRDKAAKKSYLKHKEKSYARYLLNATLKKGKIKRPTKCSACKQKKKLDAHHEDYTKPLEVIWMCRLCHIRHHKNLLCK